MALVILIQFIFNIYLLLHQDKTRKVENKKGKKEKSELMKTLEKTERITSDKSSDKKE